MPIESLQRKLTLGKDRDKPASRPDQTKISEEFRFIFFIFIMVGLPPD